MAVVVPGQGRPKIEVLGNYWGFPRVRKKIWLAPVIIVLLLLGGLVMVSQQSVLASFIYTIF